MGRDRSVLQRAGLPYLSLKYQLVLRTKLRNRGAERKKTTETLRHGEGQIKHELEEQHE